MSCCFNSFILSTLIKKSRTANAVGVMVIVFFFVIYFIDYASENISKIRLIINYFASPLSFLSLLKSILEFEKEEVYVSYYNLLRINDMKNSFYGLLASTLIYFVIAIYFDQILPQGNSFYKKWYFPITDMYKCFTKKQKNSIDEKSELSCNLYNKYIEEDPEGSKEAVYIKNIKKSFSNKKRRGKKNDVLRGIEFKTYYDEIFAILGHNGAGKTTLMNILIGILSADRGEIFTIIHHYQIINWKS
eukprot:jgi/Orpsp1_1/1184283/evm.model.c7180000088910.1